MICIKNKKFELNSASVVTLGKFDGIHKGHRKLIEEAKRIASENGLQLVVFSFCVSEGHSYPYMDSEHITTFEERESIFEQMGVDVFIEYPFDDEVARTEPIKFVENVLAKKIKASYVVVGEDYTFGHKGQGNVELLKGLQKLFNFQAIIVNKVMYNGREIGSTWIRDEIRSGNMQNVNILLTYPYMIQGAVEYGHQRGKEWGFPTLNIYPPKDKLLPPFGVYSAHVIIDGMTFKGVTNVGIRPSLNEADRISVETNLFDFDENVYGKTIEVYLLQFQRPEMKFDSIEMLKNQINRDSEFAKEFLNTII